MVNGKLLIGSSFLLLLSGCNLSIESPDGGTIVSNDGKIDCGTECAASYNESSAQLVTMEAIANEGYVFSKWTGECVDQPECVVSMSGVSGHKVLSALFLPVSGELPLFDGTTLEYQGGFRLSAGGFGEADYATLSYSQGVMAYNPANNSLFVSARASNHGIGEFAIPQIVNSRDMNDFVVGEIVLQNFSKFHDTSRVDTGIDEYFKVTGMSLMPDNKLVVNYQNWYDASGQETDTSIVFQNALDLANSDISGAFQLNGAAHAAGWLTPIPERWQAGLGGTHISGYSSGSIISRLSVGPSAFVLTPEDELLAANGSGPVPTTPLLDFDLNNILYDKTIYGEQQPDSSAILYNDNRQNDLWTIISGATYGFIVPGTSTYLTIGYSGGHESGVGYKITQDNGNLCGGPCSYDADDRYNYFWAWRVSDLINAKKGEIEPSDIRPYQYGKIDSPFPSSITGATFDPENGLLYVALKEGDKVETYARAPLYLVYKINKP